MKNNRIKESNTSGQFINAQTMIFSGFILVKTPKKNIYNNIHNVILRKKPQNSPSKATIIYSDTNHDRGGAVA